MQALVAELRAKLDTIKKGGGEATVNRHRERGKMFVRCAWVDEDADRPSDPVDRNFRAPAPNRL